MFKKFVLPAVALAAITSCSSDEVLNTNSNPDGQDYISFNTVVGNNSRAEVTKIDNLKDDKGFYVVAYGDNSLYFHRSAAKFSNEKNGWFLADNYYWPSYELTFAAWYPTVLTSSNGTWTVAGTGLYTSAGEYVSRATFNDDGGIATRHQIKDYSLPVDVENQVDIVVAREKEQRTTSSTDAVSMQFRHIFSQIEVKANYQGEGAMKVEVAGVALRYIPNKGTFTFPAGETSGTNDLANTDWTINKTAFTNLAEGTTLSDADAATFTLNRFVNEITSTELKNGETATSLNAGNKNFLVIPQDFSSFVWSETAKKDGAYLAVKVKISARQADGGYKQIYPTNNNEYGWAAVGVFSNAGLKSLKPGVHYNINLTFTDNSAGKGDPDPVDSTPDPEPDKPGEDILGEPIWFNVTVADWVANDQNINKPTTTD